MKCSACGAYETLENNRCRRCGAIETRSRLPVKRNPAPPPALWQRAAPVLARGAVLMAAGVIGEWLLRSATKKALSTPARRQKQARIPSAPVIKRDTHPADGTLIVSETVVMRRVIVRR